MLSEASKANIKGYAVIFDHGPSAWKQKGCVSTHEMEMYYKGGKLTIKQREGNNPVLLG